MVAIALDEEDRREPSRGLLLQWLDALAAWQMRHSYCRIRRSQSRRATMTGVNQPSSRNERSSMSPCER
jgi:hypothetical protein